MLTFAFYKAPGRLADRVIRIGSGRFVGSHWVPALYSHVEFVLDGPSESGQSICISASKRDGAQVRCKPIQFKPGHWTILQVPGGYNAARRFALSRSSTQYNSIGAALSITPWRGKVGRGVFCSEFMGQIVNAGGKMQVSEPHRLTPQELINQLVKEVTEWTKICSG
ncbi:MAG: hypothetical protein ABJL67_13385 [Sulfitobacter sp.]